MSSGVDTLGALTEKLKQIINDTQVRYESFIDSTQLYKQAKVNEKEYFSKIGEYLVATSAMNFLAIRVILEIKSTMEKGSSLKNPSGGLASSSSSSPALQADFEIGGFVGGTESNEVRRYTISSPQPAQQQEEPTFKPVDIVIERPSRMSIDKTTLTTKKCIVCKSIISNQAKFCSKCGNSQ
ncbi:MAG TPA: zinc ribbon domain-containing protein [Nitrososphaeraceae archaeon]|nr:zinc ribbon domain-containing protein [Nitrososphaeraceae archaeon]